jgi:hypothetical protein
MKPLSQAVIERLASGVSSGYLENEELPALFYSLMNLAQEGGAGDLPKITTQEQFDALPSGARYINRSGNVARKP